MIKIGRPVIVRTAGGNPRTEAEIVLGGVKKTLYFETQPEYGGQLVSEIADAYVIILLAQAMIRGEDIESEAPVSRELLYKLNDFFIPTMGRSTKRYHTMRVRAPLYEGGSFTKGSGVGTGFSGGVDSMYTFSAYKDRSDCFRLTHLAVFNAGVYETDSLAMYAQALQATKKFAQQQGLACIGVSCNITELVQEHYLSVSSYRLAACAAAVGKLWGTFLLSPAYEFTSFSLDEANCSYYDLFLINSLSVPYLKFFSAGGAQSRLDKIKQLAELPESVREKLHVCVHKALFGEPNCGLCPKCIRTEAAMEGLGVLERFDKAFPLKKYWEKHDEIMAQVILASQNEHMREAAQLLAIKETPEIKRYLAAGRAARKVIEKNREYLLKKMGLNLAEHDGSDQC